MRIAIVGAGIVGVTSAYELAADGHEVVVFERHSTVASETSFANAGVISPGYVAPWAAPGMTWKVLQHLLARHAPVRFAGLGPLGQLPWLWRWWRACRPEVHARNRGAMHALARASRARLFDLTREMNLDYEQTSGYTVLLRTTRELVQARPALKLLAELGVTFELIDADHCRRVEPGLNPEIPLRAAVHLKHDAVGNCRQFAHLLKAEAMRRGAQFRFDSAVDRLSSGPAPSVQLATGATESFDAVVVAAGVEANRLLAPLGAGLPLAPVYGYSVTLPLRHVDGHPYLGPRAALMDEKYKVAVSRLGERVRVAGSAEIGGRPGELSPRALATLYRVLDDWFPGVTVLRGAQEWKGARPMLPDGPPVVGASRIPGIWLNLGHGSSGWALACGSAQLLAEQIAGRPTSIDAAPFAATRLG